MASPEGVPSNDLTPDAAAPRDLASPAPKGSGRPAEEDGNLADWHAIAASPGFQTLLKAKRRFVVPAVLFFVAYYFALPLLVGFARPLMETRVFGTVNLAYLFALSQFFVAWIIAALYVRAAARFDRMAAEIIGAQRR